MNTLPLEIIDHIFSFTNINSIRTLYKYKSINKTSKVKIKKIAILRIQLWWFILKYHNSLKRHIIPRLKRCLNIPGFSTNTDNCVYYAPFNKNGMCRFCSARKNMHKFSEKLICENYLNLIII